MDHPQSCHQARYYTSIGFGFGFFFEFVKCKIIENNVIIFEIQTLANSREQAVKIVQNWEDNTGEIYPKVIELLNRERQNEVEEQIDFLEKEGEQYGR